MTVDYEFIYTFCEELLNLDMSLRWIGISNKYGVLINVEQRQGLQPLMSEEESEEYAAAAISRYRTRVKFQPKIGKLNYAVGRYENVTRVTIPISNDYFVLLTVDKEINYDDIILKKIIPFIEKNKSKFVSENSSD
ncbi:MAG TPA: hypothetical protein VJM74_00495 [Nitrososphaeraceae archaeon]|jgi:hypothetical protein|nr:hypothetical protein [Nitrososphaeraceae archaeon]